MIDWFAVARRNWLDTVWEMGKDMFELVVVMGMAWMLLYQRNLVVHDKKSCSYTGIMDNVKALLIDFKNSIKILLKIVGSNH